MHKDESVEDMLAAADRVVTPEDILESLNAIGGFLGAAAVSPMGEILATASACRVDMPPAAAFANNVLLHAKEASLATGGGRTILTYVEGTTHGFLACCKDEAAENTAEAENTRDELPEPKAHVHLHAVLVLARGGNLGLAKLRLPQALDLLAASYR
ncbi:MAG: hypothetical protein ACYCX3_00090 [Thermoleophilia bacterium]